MWVKLDDGFPEDDRVLDLSDKAFRLHVEALCACARNLTDGVLSVRRLHSLRASKAAVKELAECGLWISRGDGVYEINKYLVYNPSAEHVREERRKAAERQARHRESHRESQQSNGVTNAVSSPSPSRPVPSEEENPGVYPQSELQDEGATAEVKTVIEAQFGGRR